VDKRTSPDLRVFYLLLVGVGSLFAHVAAEFAAMGAQADHLVFSARHWYLGCAALAGIGVFIVRSRSLVAQAQGGRDLKRLLTLGLEALPLRGRGFGYYSLTAVLQLAVGSLTQLGEGCPFCSHDVIAGLLGALVTVVLLGMVTRVIGRRLPAFVCVLAGHRAVQDQKDATRFVRIELPGPTQSLGVWFPLLFNRPPPQAPAFTSLI